MSGSKLSLGEFKERLRVLREENPEHWAASFSSGEGEGKVSKRVMDKKSLEKFMPFMESRIRSEGCKGLNHNKYLYTQCTRKVLEGGYCKICKKSADKNGGIPKYGSIEERKKCPLSAYKPEKAKGAIRYLDVLSNNNITRKEMEEYAESIGVTIPDEIWDDDYKRVHPGKGRKKKCVNGDEDKSPKKKRGRPKKEKKEKSPKKKRGRPKKVKKSEELTPKERAAYMAKGTEHVSDVDSVDGSVGESVKVVVEETVSEKEVVVEKTVSEKEVVVEITERPTTPTSEDDDDSDASDEEECYETAIVKTITHEGVEYNVDNENNLRDSEGEEKGMIMDDGEIVVW